MDFRLWIMESVETMPMHSEGEKSGSPYGVWLMFSFACRDMRRVVRCFLLDCCADDFQVVVAYRLSPDDDDNDICVATRIR